MTLGESIRQHRKASRITATYLAEKMNISRNTIHNWEKGTSSPRSKQLYILCTLLGCRVEEVLQGSTPKQFQVHVCPGA